MFMGGAKSTPATVSLLVATPVFVAALIFAMALLLWPATSRAGESGEALVEALPVAESAPAKNACEAGAGIAAARRVQSRYDGIRDLNADFEQQSQSASFAGQPLMDAEPKTGRVVFAKPGKMRWTYGDPDPSVVVSDGATLWIHDVEGGNATRLEVTAGYLSGAALQFLLGDGNILEEFDVKATACTSEHITLDLLPKLDASYERLGLVARRGTGDIDATSVVDLFGNRTEIRFKGVEVNRSPDASVFQFEVPEGVEVIDYAGSQAP
jgi:outer membrane lipoprotein carrier protein